jgi:hypothetical protein
MEEAKENRAKKKLKFKLESQGLRCNFPSISCGFHFQFSLGGYVKIIDKISHEGRSRNNVYCTFSLLPPPSLPHTHTHTHMLHG